MADPALAPIAEREYGPSDAELDWAQRVVAAVEAAGEGRAAHVDGRVVEPGYLDEARRLLGLAAAIARRAALSPPRSARR
jgi:citrate lyase subunit beta/citryl-CoA lyase